MKMWEKAKEKFPGLSKTDFIVETCPSELGMEDIKDPECFVGVYLDFDLCNKCWEREIN